MVRIPSVEISLKVCASAGRFLLSLKRGSTEASRIAGVPSKLTVAAL